MSELHRGMQLPRRPSWLAPVARPLVLRMLSRIQEGCLVLREGLQRWQFGSPTNAAERDPSMPAPIHATMVVRKPRFWVDLLLAGSIGGTESYVAAAWDADDVTKVLQLFLRNRHLFINMDLGWLPAMVRYGYRLLHARRRNTVSGSRENIAAHYDLGNEFYELFLDSTMTYSAGVFTGPGLSLAEAQREKYALLCRKVGLASHHHLLEIGTGWGGLAEYAAREIGCRVTTTTISRRQYAYAKERLNRAGLADRVTLLQEDYRNITGTYDRLISVEMVEAVGYEFLPTFFRTCAALLKPSGLLAIQSITIREQLFARHIHEVDFIKRYIFPGGCLTSVTAMCETMTAHTDLQMFDLQDITPHYRQTLRCWLERFRANESAIRALGFDKRFRRLWELYFQYCEAGFAEQYIGSIQFIAGRAGKAPPVARI